MWQSIELTTGRPGFPSLWIFGSKYNFGVFAAGNLSPSAKDIVDSLMGIGRMAVAVGL